MDEELLAKVRKAAIIGAFFALAVVFAIMGWTTALKIYVVLVGLFATLAILIQSGKGGGLAASLGGLGGESLLGVRSATPIAKATYLMLALFLFNCMLIALVGPAEHKGEGLSEKAAPPPAQQSMPVLPATGAAPTIPAAPAMPPATPSEKPATEAPTPAAPEAPGAPSPQPGGNQQP